MSEYLEFFVFVVNDKPSLVGLIVATFIIVFLRASSKFNVVEDLALKFNVIINAFRDNVKLSSELKHNQQFHIAELEQLKQEYDSELERMEIELSIRKETYPLELLTQIINRNMQLFERTLEALIKCQYIKREPSGQDDKTTN